MGFSPVGGWHGCMDEEGAHTVVKGMRHTFGFAILGGGVRA